MNEDLKKLLKEALISKEGGNYDGKTAANILCGSNRMDSNIRALKMEEHFFISPTVWLQLYTKKS